MLLILGPRQASRPLLFHLPSGQVVSQGASRPSVPSSGLQPVNYEEQLLPSSTEGKSKTGFE